MTADTRTRRRCSRSRPAVTVARPFIAPPCARCGASLTDADGNPRWEIIGDFTLVCLEVCRMPT